MAVEPFLGTRKQKLFIITIFIQAVVILGMIGESFTIINAYVPVQDPQYRTVPCYLALFALAELFELSMAFDALRSRNVVQLIGLIAFHASLIITASLQIGEIHTSLVTQGDCSGYADRMDYINCGGPGTLWKRIQPFLIVVVVMVSVSWFILMFFVKHLYTEFGWAIFHAVGADPRMKNMYQRYQVLICLLKFDFFAFIGVTMQLLILVIQSNSKEFGITIAAIPIVIALLIATGLAVQREVKWIMVIALALMVLSEVYFVYKLVRYFQPGPNGGPNAYFAIRASLTTYTIVAFVLLFASFVIGLLCFADFGEGLDDAKMNALAARWPAFGRSRRQTMSEKEDGMTGTEKDLRTSAYGGGMPIGPRISIE